MTNKSQQWFFLTLIALWLILSLLAPLVAFVSTGNLLCLTAFADIAPPTYLLSFLEKRIHTFSLFWKYATKQARKYVFRPV